MPTNRLRPHVERESQTTEPGAGNRPLEQMCASLWESAKQTLTRQVSQAPVASLGAALAVGVFVGWLIKRR